MSYLFVLEIIGTIAFAIGGSILAIKNKMDLLGVIILSIISALGGGLLRDIVLNRNIVLFAEPIYLATSIVVALIIFLFFYSVKRIDFFDKKEFNVFLNVIDGLGLGVFVVIGANAAIALTTNVLFIIFCALLTSVGGGVIRDLMINRIPIIFRKHIYALAALLGIIIYLIFFYCNLEGIGSVMCIVFITALRIISQHFKLSLPKIEIKE